MFVNYVHLLIDKFVYSCESKSSGHLRRVLHLFHYRYLVPRLSSVLVHSCFLGSCMGSYKHLTQQNPSRISFCH